ncbi:predicted protein [Paecilomyces variotii No. 5]|uniref:Uncharacterized protein n=1 Tax=Byssochlamys spectabilis (strain No. 5 / NBRC 109023) TaxID=1356009 RepID=V5HV53_BYSSN|nr:predicted protein [Paecilomyces variotii No. 5]
MEGRTALEIEAAEALRLLSMGGHQRSIHETQEQMNTGQNPPRDVGNSTPSPATAQSERSSNTRVRAPTHSQASTVPAAATNQTALQAYLIHQQRLAGIAPDKIVMMDELRNSQQQAGQRQNRGPPPPILQITNDGVVIPHIPPAQFNGAVPDASAIISQSAVALRALEIQAQRRGRANVPRGGRSLRSRQRQGPRLAHGRSVTQQAPVSSQESESSRRNALITTLQPGRQNAPLVPSSATSLVRPSSQLRTAHGMNSATANNEFNVFNAIMKNPELAFIFAKHLDIRELISLYAISRDFHNLMNTRFAAMIIAQAKAKAPESAQIFPFRCYRKLCIEDPARNPHPDPARAVLGVSRDVPSFKWLQMLLWRDKIVMDIVRLLHQEGMIMPRNCITAIKKIWFMMDIPDNARRIGLIQNQTFWPDADLFFAMLFIVKLDLRFTDPLTGGGNDRMRKLALAQETLTVLWRLLQRPSLWTHLETLRGYARWKYEPPPHQVGKTLFGVPPEDIGRLQFENYGKTGRRVPMQLVDDLLIKECIRRQLGLHLRYNDMLMWGFVSPRWDPNAKERFLREIAEEEEAAKNAETQNEPNLSEDPTPA